MSTCYIAVCDLNENYALNLSGAIMDSVSGRANIVTFTRVSALKEFGLTHEIDVLIISETSYEPCVSDIVTGTIMVLRENPEFMQEEVILIDRFQSREDLIKSVIKNLPECLEGISVKRLESHHWKVIGIYSPVRRCLQTSFALSLGQLLATDYKTLYMNFENYSGFSGWFGTEFGSDVIDLLYYYDCDKNKLSTKIPLMTHKLGALDIMPPAASYYDTYERSGSKWVEVMKSIEDATEYEYLILDLTDSMHGLLQVMEYCDRIYTLVLPDRISQAKIAQYESWMVEHFKADIISKTMKFSLPQFTDLPMNPSMLTHCELAGYVNTIIKEDTLGMHSQG